MPELVEGVCLLPGRGGAQVHEEDIRIPFEEFFF